VHAARRAAQADADLIVVTELDAFEKPGAQVPGILPARRGKANEEAAMAKPDTITIAFPNGGILPSSVTGGAEKPIGAHQPVEVPLAYGQHLINDRFAYKARPPRKNKSESPVVTARMRLEAQLASLREQGGTATHPDHKAKLAEQIAGAEAQLADLKD
jgi:hypothetical protein